MRSSAAALILAFAMAVQAAPTSITGSGIHARSPTEMVRDVATADAADTRTFEYDADGNEIEDGSLIQRDSVAEADAADARTFEYDADGNEIDNGSSVKRWIQDFVERAITPGEEFAERDIVVPSMERRSPEELAARVAAADALDTRNFEVDEEEEEDDRAPVKRWIQDFVERAITPGEKFAEN